LFLRNHDELTLEMCAGEERDYMYYAYPEIRSCGATSASRGGWHRCWTMIVERSSCSTAWCLRFLEVRLFTTGMKSAWETMSIWGIAMASGRPCNGLLTETADFRRPILRSSTFPPFQIPSMAST